MILANSIIVTKAQEESEVLVFIITTVSREVGGPRRKKTKHGFLDIREVIFGLSHFGIYLMLAQAIRLSSRTVAKDSRED